MLKLAFVALGSLLEILAAVCALWVLLCREILGFLLEILADVCALWVLLCREIDDLTRNE